MAATIIMAESPIDAISDYRNRCVRMSPLVVVPGHFDILTDGWRKISASVHTPWTCSLDKKFFLGPLLLKNLLLNNFLIHSSSYLRHRCLVQFLKSDLGMWDLQFFEQMIHIVLIYVCTSLELETDCLLVVLAAWINPPVPAQLPNASASRARIVLKAGFCTPMFVSANNHI